MKYRVEFGFAENVMAVNEWQTIDGLDTVDANSSEDAAKWAACTDGLENALFRVIPSDTIDGHNWKYFNF